MSEVDYVGITSSKCWNPLKGSTRTSASTAESTRFRSATARSHFTAPTVPKVESLEIRPFHYYNFKYSKLLILLAFVLGRLTRIPVVPLRAILRRATPAQAQKSERARIGDLQNEGAVRRRRGGLG